MAISITFEIASDNLDSAREWLHFAIVDLESAKYLRGMRPIPHEVICYHCQQSAEKGIKAVMVLNQREPKKTHDLINLIKEAITLAPQLTPLIPVVAGLTDYATITRYPPSLQVGLAESVRAISDAEQVINICNQIIGSFDRPLT